MKIIIGSRGSKLAIAQSEEVKAALSQIDPTLDIEIKVISTKGDRILDKPLAQIGDKGLFTQEIEAGLIDETIDMAVHSMKDMPTTIPEALMFCGTIKANEENDCLVFNHGYQTLKDLPLGAKVATVLDRGDGTSLCTGNSGYRSEKKFKTSTTDQSHH